MALSERLRSGELGLVVQPPASLLSDDELSLTFADGEGRRWWYFWKPGVHFDLSPARHDALVAQLHAYSRAMFDDLFEDQRRAGAVPEGAPRRTGDASWSPLVEVTPLELHGRRALGFIHRMLYLPGSEVLLGHTLIPTALGTFEARWLTTNGKEPTGVRESAVLLLRGASGLLAQAEYDDPKLDARFPTHPLSLARDAARWHESALGRVTAPRPVPRQHAVQRVGRFELPDGFVPTHEPGLFGRMWFCTTDGIDWLIVERLEEKVGAFFRQRAAEKAAKARFLENVQEVGFTPALSPLEHDGVPGFVAESAGDTRAQRPRSVMGYRVDSVGRVWVVTLHSTAVRPVAALAEDTARVVTSLALVAQR